MLKIELSTVKKNISNKGEQKRLDFTSSKK